MHTLRIGTRGSALARWQAQWVADQLRHKEISIEVTVISTTGDRQTGPLTAGGSPGLFTKEIQGALLREEIDVAVHSLKDLPTQSSQGLTLAAIPARESPWDVLVSSNSAGLQQLAAGACVGTGSPRRKAQLLNMRPDLQVKEVRGNVGTRLEKLAAGQFDGLILAEAGLRRLGLQEQISEVLSADQMLPAVGQGALAVEIRSQDHESRKILETLNDPATAAAVLAERSVLATLQAGCLAPVATWGRIQDDRLLLDAIVLSGDGSKRLFAQGAGRAAEAREIGQEVAQLLLQQGAAGLIAEAHAPE